MHFSCQGKTGENAVKSPAQAGVGRWWTEGVCLKSRQYRLLKPLQEPDREATREEYSAILAVRLGGQNVSILLILKRLLTRHAVWPDNFDTPARRGPG